MDDYHLKTFDNAVMLQASNHIACTVPVE